jgi:peroxiredoxin
VGRQMRLIGTKIDGSRFEWDAYRGKVVLVMFHTVSDLAGRPDLPVFRKNYERYHDRGFDVVEIGLDQDSQQLDQLFQHEDLPWVTLHDEQAPAGHPTAVYYGITSTPKMFFVGQDGKVISTEVHVNELDELLQKSLGPPYVPEGRLTYVDFGSKANQRLTERLHDDSDNDLKELPQGEQSFAGVRFRIVDGLIHLASTRLRDKPEGVEGIELKQRFAKLYILHASGGGVELAHGALIGEYRVHYEDETTGTIPIVYGEDLRDWWNRHESQPTTRAALAWVGSNPSSRRGNVIIRLYVSAWENPHPEKKAVSIDYISAMTTAAPFCVAMTAEEPLRSTSGP